MNLHIKGHHMTRQISKIIGSPEGKVLVLFKNHPPFLHEYLLFSPNEGLSDNNGLFLDGIFDFNPTESTEFTSDNVFFDKKVSELKSKTSKEIAGDNAGFTSEGPELNKNKHFFNPLRDSSHEK